MMQALAILVAALAVAGVIVMLLRPHWAFVLVITMWPLEQLLQSYLSVLARFNQLFNYFVGIIALVAVVMRLSRRQDVLSAYWNPATFLTLLLYFLWAIGIIYSPGRDHAAEGFLFSLRYQILLLVILPLIIVDIFEFRKMLTGFMLVGSLIAILIMLNPTTSYYSGRLSLDLGMAGAHYERGNPLALAELGGLLALVAALIRPASVSPFFNILRITAFVAGMGLAIASGSRGQVLAACATGVLFFPVARKLASPKQFFFTMIGLGTLILGLFVMFKLFISDQNRARWDTFALTRDLIQRFDMVWVLFSAYLANPASWLFGLGTSAYVVYSTDRHTVYPHNVIAEVVCEQGLAGAIVLLLITVLTIKYGRRLWEMYRDDAVMRATIACLFAICLFYLLLSLKQGSVAYPAPFYWWLILSKLSYQEQRLGVPAADSALDDAYAESHDDDWDAEDDAEFPADDNPPQSEPQQGDYALGY